jgi:tetratricopeptide (TPR) repeat protein/HEAT repeat protein
VTHRRVPIVLAALIALGLSAGSDSAWAQFNPSGRKKQPSAPKPGSARTPAKPSRAPARPATPTGSAAAAPTEFTDGQAPNQEALVARYTAVVLAQPGASFPLQRLAQLYRERDGNLDKLLADFEQRAAQPGQSRFNALVALAGLYRQDGQNDRALATYQRAASEQPKNPVALSALAALFTERGDKAKAREHYEQVLPLLKDDAEREQTLRTLVQLSLDTKDYDRAKGYHRKLVERARGSFFVRAELGRELLQRGDYARAADEFRDVVAAASGDNRVVAPALRDYGRALVKSGKREEGLKQLRRALALAGSQAGVRREIYDVIVEAYRDADRLPGLVKELETAARDYDELRLLGALYEETGKVDLALKTYEKALDRNPKDLETRIKVVQLLQIQGELDRAIKQYELLIAAAPQNADFVFQLAEALLQRGDRQKALEQLKRLEARGTQDEDTLAALVDFYERVDEKPRAMALLQRLTQVGSRDPQHLVELGSRFWQQDDKKRALQTWERIKSVVPDRALALQTLGEVYLEHDLVKEALEALSEAARLRPKDLKFKKAFALALERAGAASASRDFRVRQYEDARKIWEELLKGAGDNAHAAREARQHIVTLWALSGQLLQRVAPLERRLRATPPDLESGRLLAEVLMRLRRYPDAERTLQLIVQKAPGDTSSLLQLERVLVQQRKLQQAIKVLETLVRADPKRARESYQRMAQYAAELYQDDQALRYAARAVELGPDDAEGHRKLGDMYRKRQDVPRAVQAYRQAIAKNDRLFAVYFQLAELLINQSEVEEADKLLRRVMRASPDEELVSQAARLSMQVNLGRGTLESLEKDLLPLALANPQKPIYRRLLIDIYGALAFPLVHQAHSGAPELANRATEALKRLGERAVKPLLDALGDERDAQQRVAIELLGHIDNKSAGPALIAFAAGNAPSELRTRAVLAAGALRDPALIPRYRDVLTPRGQVVADESDPVVVAAAYGLATMRSPAAQPLLTELLASDAPTVKALAVLGLGLAGDKRSTGRIADIARAADVGPLPRATAAFALGQLGASSETETLTQLTQSTDSSVRAAAVLALARLRAPNASRVAAEALVSGDQELQRAGAVAACVMATGQYRPGIGDLPGVRARVDVRDVLRNLHPSGYTADERVRALTLLAPALRAVVQASAQGSPERARGIVDALTARNSRRGFAPLTSDLSSASAASARSAAETADAIAAAAVPAFVSLSRHPSADVRAEAVAFLAHRPERDARVAVLGALTDSDQSVQRAGLAALSDSQSADAAPAIATLLKSARDWSVRVRAAEALGRVPHGPDGAVARAALVHAAAGDPFALVREAALRSLSRVSPAEARAVLSRAARTDEEPRVRKLAQELAAALR